MKLMFSHDGTPYFSFRASLPPVQHKGTGANDYAVVKFQLPLPLPLPLPLAATITAIHYDYR